MAHTEERSAVRPAAEAAEGSVAYGVFVAAFVAVAVAVAAASARRGPQAELPPAAVPSADSPREVRGAQGAIATAAPEASAVGLEVLRKGGNAFDALVAASFAISVVRPQSTGIGGGGFVVFHDAARGVEGVLDGRETAPKLATPDMFVEGGRVIDGYRRGPLAAGVPGLVRMLYRLYEEHGSGKLSWAELVAPAVRLAERGFRVPPPLAAAIRRHADELARYPSSAKVFLPGGIPPAPGDRLVQADLALTLQTIAEEGADGFYRGWVAEKIARAASSGGGLISREDLASYEAKEREPVEGVYRGLRVVSMPPPSSGGVHLVQMLNVLSRHDLRSMGWQSADHLHLLAEVMRRAFADRAQFMADTDFVEVPVARLLDPAYAALLDESIDMERATPSDEILPGANFVLESDHTTHISIVDGEGNAVASTQTINTSLGSLYVAEGTGVLLNNEMADFTADPDAPNPFGLSQSAKNLPAPGKRPLSSMTPTIVLDAGGKVRAVVGSPGGPKIITTVLQVLSNMVDFGMGPLEAVAAPRIHHQWKYAGQDLLLAERGVRSLKALGLRGHQVRVVDAPLGNAQVVVVEADGTRVAASDPRGTGRPGAYSLTWQEEASRAR
ncbi:MAG: gamma-glutamyltransferase [Planctomycetota bacterium]|nr:MAG: gamma-glutamyltransferase [Planctomycetota bacterium]